jgi:hypothetical protein
LRRAIDRGSGTAGQEVRSVVKKDLAPGAGDSAVIVLVERPVKSGAQSVDAVVPGNLVSGLKLVVDVIADAREVPALAPTGRRLIQAEDVNTRYDAHIRDWKLHIRGTGLAVVVQRNNRGAIRQVASH